VGQIPCLKAGEFAAEGKGDFACRAVSLLGDDQLCFATLFSFFLFILGVVGGAVEKSDDIGILLDGS